MASCVSEAMQTQPIESMHMKLTNKAAHGLQPQPPSYPKPKGRLRIDPQRALEPARKKLSTLESQRIMAVLAESIRKSELLASFPRIIQNLDRYSVALGSDLVKMFEEHRVIIESFEELRSEAERIINRGRKPKVQDDVINEEDEGKEDEDNREITEQEQQENPDELNDTEHQNEHESPKNISDQSRGSTSSEVGSQANEVLQNLSLVAKQMQFSCKNILRAFSANPASWTAVMKENPERTESTDEMLKELNELKDILMGMLLTTPVEEAERNQYLKEISERERYHAGIIEKLEVELKMALDDKEEEIRKKNDVIRRLQADLHQIEKFSEENIKKVKSEAEKQEAADSKNSEGKRVKLQQEISQLKSQLQNLTQEHRESEQNLRKKKFKVETEVENWIQKYDQEMGERQNEYEEIDAVYTEEKKQLNELEERFKTLETEHNQIQEERRIARERREAAERELQMSIKAATTIQAFWRSFKVRKALKSKKKKGGKKKGKK